MKITSGYNEDGLLITVSAQVFLDLEHNRLIYDGAVIPVEIISEDFIRVGRLLIHRSALQEGGWHEYTFRELGFANSKGVEPTG